jgi:serine/threonine-protein kinase
VRTFGKYTLLEPLASGGMADVFRAETAGAAGVTKEVALKLVRGEHGADDEFVRMFIQEARLASRLTHANVVQVFEFDAVDGRYYIAMELVRGRNLARVMERCREQGVRLGLPRAVHLTVEAARGLAYAHRLAGTDGRPLGLVHRDVSPHNLLVSFEGEVKIADFGIARAMGRAGLTAPGTIKGKLAYMAPEQARGEAVDARADVFSLGIVLWELCTGRRLLARESEAAVLAALLAPDPVSAPSAWNEEVPPELDAIVLAALEKDPARRTRSAEELAQGLSRVLLRLARAPEDWDLRALMHRLWPEGAAPPAAAPEETRVRAPAAAGDAPAADDATRTAPAPEGRRRPARWLAAALVASGAIAAAVAGTVRRSDPHGPAAAAPPGGSASSGPELERGSPSPPERAERDAPAAPPAGIAGPTPAPADLGAPAAPLRAPPAPPAAEATVKARVRSAPGIYGLPVPAASSGDGVVSVNANPWANLSVDGVRVGETPRTVRLPAGLHRLRLEHPRHAPIEKVVEVRAGRRESWNATLSR